MLPGRVVAAQTHDWMKGFPNSLADVDGFLIGAKVTEVARRGKVLFIHLDSGYSLMTHLKMTGQLVFVPAGRMNDERGTANDEVHAEPTQNSKLKTHSSPHDVRFGAGHPNDSLIGALPDKSTRVTLKFADGSHLYFNDQRKFGWMKLLPTMAIADEPFIQKLGPEPLQPKLPNTIFVQRMQTRPNTSVKAALLDQSVIAGVGNIYADEALWAARIHPARVVKTLSDAELTVLVEELISVLELSIEKGGSTDRNYVNAEGKKGSYISFAKVFRREGQPCERCGATIAKTRVAGRGTHICEKCQQNFSAAN